MSDFARRILIISIVGILISSVIIILNFEIKYLKSQLSIVNLKMVNLETQLSQQEKRVEIAQKEAQKESSNIQKHTDIILKTKLPDDCHAVIQWGIKQAKGV